MARIPIRNRAGDIVCYATVDDDDYEKVSQRNWALSANGQPVSGTTKNYKTSAIYMHHLILDTSKPIAHLNKDKLDCRKANLVERSMRQIQTTRVLQDNNSSGFKGVYWNKTAQKWIAQGKYGGKTAFSRRFDDPEDAAKFYDEKMTELHGAQVVTNRSMGLID